MIFALLASLWMPVEFIWNLGLVSECQMNTGCTPEEYFEYGIGFDVDGYRNVKKGDLVWVKSSHVSRFALEALEVIEHPFILVICDGDESFPSDYAAAFDVEAFIGHEKIQHIFAQNCDYVGSDKVTPIPIGIDFHTNAYKRWRTDEKLSPEAQCQALSDCLQTLKPTHQRKKKAFVDFQLNDTLRAGFERYKQVGEDRATIFQTLLKTGLIDHGSWMKRSDLWKTKGAYAFSIAPHGNGLDTHRLWEDLVLGCIVIVKTSPLDPLYEGLPVVIVKSWDEITEENLDTWLGRFRDAFTNPQYRERLTHRYWADKLKNARRDR